MGISIGLGLGISGSFTSPRGGLDSATISYVAAVEAADGQALEGPVVTAINNFIVGCKADGIWTAIKASCILAGARTLTGALVPLVGPSPTNLNFVSGDYNRETGLLGNAINKSINSNYSNSAATKNNNHLSCYVTTQSPTIGSYIGNLENVTNYSTVLGRGTLTQFSRNRTSTLLNHSTALPEAVGFFGVSRSVGTSCNFRARGSTEVFTVSSVDMSDLPFHVFSRAGATPSYIATRMPFYSAGEFLNLTLLDTRVSTLITAIGAAI